MGKTKVECDPKESRSREAERQRSQAYESCRTQEIVRADESTVGSEEECLIAGQRRESTSQLAHENAMKRVVQAGAKPVTSLQVMLEWQRDWANRGRIKREKM